MQDRLLCFTKCSRQTQVVDFYFDPLILQQPLISDIKIKTIFPSYEKILIFSAGSRWISSMQLVLLFFTENLDNRKNNNTMEQNLFYFWKSVI